MTHMTAKHDWNILKDLHTKALEVSRRCNWHGHRGCLPIVHNLGSKPLIILL